MERSVAHAKRPRSLESSSGSECDKDDATINQLEGERDFRNRIDLMDMLTARLVDLKPRQIQKLSQMIDEDKMGLFNRTWGSMSFALRVKSACELPQGRIGGLDVLRIVETKASVGHGRSGDVLLATVWKGEHKLSNCAIKFTSAMIDARAAQTDGMGSEEWAGEEHVSELMLLSQLCNAATTASKYCVRVHGVTVGNDRRIGIVMERYAMDLDTLVVKHFAGLTEVQRLRMFCKCVQCVQALHLFGSPGIVHNDVKAKNFLIGPGAPPGIGTAGINDDVIDSIVITDFGFSKVRARETQQHKSGAYTSIGGIAGPAAGTARYAAPEVKEALASGEELVYTFRSDIYSLGVLLGFIFCGKQPYEHLKSEFQIFQSSCKPFDPTTLKGGLVRALFNWCTECNRDDRPASCEQILEVIDSCSIASLKPDVNTVINGLKQKNLPLKLLSTSDFR